MIKASERLGLTAKGVKADHEALHSVALPLIAHVIIDDRLQHFIAVYKITNDSIEYMDPADGFVNTQNSSVRLQISRCKFGRTMVLGILYKTDTPTVYSR